MTPQAIQHFLVLAFLRGFERRTVFSKDLDSSIILVFFYMNYNYNLGMRFSLGQPRC